MTKLTALLDEKFGFKTFKEGQRATIESVLENQRTLSILPTGTGKSLCYQLPSYLLPGATVIVSPLISLMEDQVQQLHARGEKSAIAINSQLSFNEKSWALTHLADYKFIFFSPETLLQEAVKIALQSLQVSLFVVDEAHCISQWGVDFRPEYEHLLQLVIETDQPKGLALTATATTKVSQDIKEKLFGNQPVSEVRHSVNRPTIFYEVAKPDDKLIYVLEYLSNQTGAGIIYFSSKKEAEKIAKIINTETTQTAAFYHGDLTGQERSLIQQQFISGQLTILCATSAFGMGINKSDIRFVIHYHLPGSIEAYMQESGRSGRDGKPSHSLILYQVGDERIHYFLQGELDSQIATFSRYNEMAQLGRADQRLLTDLQQKWLAGYLNHSYTMAELAIKLQEKQQEKGQQLAMMLAYIQSTRCRREFLLAYFGETNGAKEPFCCDNCGTYATIFNEESQEKEVKWCENWEESLKKLFNI